MLRKPAAARGQVAPLRKATRSVSLAFVSTLLARFSLSLCLSRLFLFACAIGTLMRVSVSRRTHPRS